MKHTNGLQELEPIIKACWVWASPPIANYSSHVVLTRLSTCGTQAPYDDCIRFTPRSKSAISFVLPTPNGRKRCSAALRIRASNGTSSLHSQSRKQETRIYPVQESTDSLTLSARAGFLRHSQMVRGSRDECREGKFSQSRPTATMRTPTKATYTQSLS